MFRSLLIATLVLAGAAHADTLPSNVRAKAVRRTSTISIDGSLDEANWASAPRHGGFTQRQPKDGVAPTHDTKFSLLYDDDAIYVGVWAYDSQPDQIRALLVRRDVDALSDMIAVGIDSYHDRRTAYVFFLNAAGVQRDVMLFDDMAEDNTWDAVWTGDVKINADGWTAEYRIPLNQLRFNGENNEWGLQVVRFVARLHEQSAWSPWPRASNQIVSRFGVLDGLDRVKQGRRLELLPYASGGVEVQPIEAGDPLNAHSAALGNVGLDLKYGLGPAFTLSAAINPDFGQVEADPSQVNLSANELFFPEKRPFFIEGVDLFKLPLGSGDNLIEGAFYSRRIGAAPDAPDMAYDYISAPTSTTIYGAAKLTGKTTNGLSVGLLNAVTGEETATIVDGNTRMEPVVAPLSSYSVGRIKKDFRGGKTTLGASATAVHRALADTPLASSLHDQAYTLGGQFTHRWDDNRWELDVHGVGSYVHGSEEAIAATQTNNRHRFQRPDASHVHFDPTRKSLSGAALTWAAGPSGQTEHWRIAMGGEVRTPGLELNDAGFQFGTDTLENWLWTEYRDEDPGKELNSWRTSIVMFTLNSLEPQMIVYGGNIALNAQLSNYWNFYTGASVDAAGWDPIALRGGPALRTNLRYGGRFGFGSDSRKAVRVGIDMNANRDPTADSMQVFVGGGVTVQARSNVELFLGPSWHERTDPLQYVDEVADDAGGTHYVFGRIRQTTAALTARVNWTFSPKLSLQAYAQPFLATGSYSELKDVDNPHAAKFDDRFTRLDYTVEDGTVRVMGTNGYSFGKPDFDFGQLRSTLVLRWEYRPGSALFAIWSHGQTHEDDSRFHLGDGFADLVRAPTEDVVMVKANYWIGL